MVAALSLTLVILWALNVFSGIVSGVWLAVIGEWRLIGVGIMMSLAMPWAFMIVMLPQLGLMGLLGPVVDRGKTFLLWPVGFLTSLYGNTVIGVWVFLVFLVFSAHMGNGNHIPLLLWGYATSMAPLAYMASKEPPDSTGTNVGLLLAQLAYVLLVILHYSVDSFKVSIVGVSCLISVCSLVAPFVAASSARAIQAYSYDDENLYFMPEEFNDMQVDEEADET